MPNSSSRSGPVPSSSRRDSSKNQESAAPSSSTEALSASAVLQALYDRAPMGLAVLDTQLRYVRINERLAEINGLSVAEHLGKTVREVVPDLADTVESIVHHVLKTGEPGVDLEVRGETAAQPGVERVWKSIWTPIYDAQGKAVGINVIAEEVTEQKRAEAALQNSQTQYYQLFEAMEDGFCVCELLLNEEGDPYDYRFLEVNPAFEDHSGLKDAAGKTMYELVPDMESYWAESYRGVALMGERIRFEQGSEAMGRWFDVYAFPFGPPDSHQFAIQFKDITARKQAEKALAQSTQEVERQRQQLQSLFEQAPVAIAIYRGPQQVIELANVAMCKLWGRSANEVLNKPFAEALPELVAQGYQELQDNVLQTGESYTGHEVSVTVNRDGQPYQGYYDFIAQALHDERGEITGLMAVATEVSERVAARQQEYKLTAMLDNSSDFIGLATPEAQGIYVNPAGLEMMGLEVSQPVSELKITDFFFEEDLPFVQNTIVPMVLEKGRWIGEYRFRHFRTGRAVPVLYNSFAVKDPTTGELLGLATITIDITERKQREAELQRYQEKLALTNQELAAMNEEMAATNEELSATNTDLIETNERLERVNADLDNFVYAASHDLKAPISNIKGLLTLLEQQLSPDDTGSARTQKVLQMMEASVARFMRTIADLSDVARLQRRDQEPEVMVNLKAVIDEVCLDIAPAIEKAQAQIDVDVAGCEPIRFAPKHLRSVVYNLLSNAVKYHDSRRQPVVRVRCEEEEDCQVLTVADNGLGIDLSEDRQLFGLFRRFHSHVEGTGIGLYMVKKIVENAGGTIHVESAVGMGTTFTVRFKRW